MSHEKQFGVHDVVYVYDRFRFAIPLKAEILEFSQTNDGVRLRLLETNHPGYPIGCDNVWVHESQLSHAVQGKEPPFQPEYFSGLNWHKIDVGGKKYQFSDNGKKWTISPAQVIRAGEPCADHDYRPFLSSLGLGWFFARTCPEVHTHPTIKITVNGKTHELPMPETEAPKEGDGYWLVHTGSKKGYFYDLWNCNGIDKNRLINNSVHLTEARAKAWADFWRELHK